MTRIIGPTGSRRRRRFLFLPALMVAFVALFYVGGAQAVHDAGLFQLDGNATTDASPPAPAGDDWDRVCHQVNPTACPSGTSTQAGGGATAVDWTAEPNLNSTIFTGGGSKDPQDISSWAWKDGAGGLPDKDNLLHEYAARYSVAPSSICPSGGAATCDILYFGSDRLDNSGDAQQGFWFFQNKITLGSNSVGGGTGFNGVHKNGDLLIISDFSNGGGTSTITVLRWDTSCKKAGGTASDGKPCGDANLAQLQTSTAANCATAGPTDGFCGLVNADTITMPWSFTDKSGTPGNGALNGEFYEGGVNLSTLGLSNECFSSVAAETRSSTSTTATLKDFVLGNFGECTAGLTTTPDVGSGGSVSIGTGSASVHDTAQLKVTGVPTWSGTLTFFLCGPNDLTSQSTCATGGTQIGSGQTVTNATVQPISSDSATVTKVGNYCWRGEFVHTTTGVPDSTDSSSGECFSVTPVTPTLGTQASGSVEIGHTISDTATLTGTANHFGTPVINPSSQNPAGGQITWTAYGPNNCTTVAFGPVSRDVSGDGTYPTNSQSAVSFTPTSAGTYTWVASYSGDSPNTGSVPASACPDTTGTETVVVTPKQPGITTQVNHEVSDPVTPGTALTDTATLSGTATPSNGVQGTITFTAYGPQANTTTCSTLAYTSTIAVTGDGSYLSSNGSGGPFNPIVPGNYNWIASYTPGSGDVNNQSATTACGDAHEGSLVIKLQPNMNTAQSFVPNDSATISVGSGAGNLAGTVQFKLYVNNTSCSGSADYTSANINIDSGTPNPGTAGLTKTVSSNNATAYSTSGTTFSWVVTFTSSNPGHENVSSPCTNETSSITINNGSQKP